jgi:hypothetical protein
MIQEANPHSTPSNFPHDTQELMLVSLKAIEVAIETNGGHFLKFWETGLA